MKGSAWIAGATFFNDKIITTTTRIVAVQTSDLNYEEVKGGGSTGPAYLGYKTPWIYLDCNRFDLHFTPHEFQILTEQYSDIAPHEMHTALQHITVKDINKVNQDTTITDSATGGLCIFEDKDYSLPYVIGCGQVGTPPTDMGHVYDPPQYAYLTVCKYTGGKVKPTENSALYVLECNDFEILTTGSSWQTTYSFGDVPRKSLTGHCQYLMQTDNPTLDSRYCTVQSNNMKKIEHNAYGEKPTNWLPGPNLSSSNIQSFRYGTKTHETDSYALVPGPPTNMWQVGTDAYTQYNNKRKVPYDHLISNIAGEPGSTLLAKIRGQNRDQLYMPLMPGAMWETQGLHHESQIWAKIPNVEHTFIPQPHLGGWGLKKPPPMILMKMLPMPGPPTIRGALVQYATMLWTTTIVWKATKRSDKRRWNPQPMIPVPYTEEGEPAYLITTDNSSTKYSEPGHIWVAKHRVKNL